MCKKVSNNWFEMKFIRQVRIAENVCDP